jgi:site-specific recombinase XerD
MGKRIDRVDARKNLTLRRDPYWQRLSQGRYVGFRKMTKGSEGTWLARAYSDAGYAYETLGDFATLPDNDRFDAAKKAAEAWFQHLDLGGSTQPHTVKAACESYLEKLKVERSEQAMKDTEGYFRRLVYSDPIAKILLSKLSKTHMAGWRERVLKHNDDRSSFNRNITPLRAALNLAHEQGKVGTDQAWLTALRPFSEQELESQCERRRTGTLDREERRALVEGASDEARPLFKALAILPMRPGEVAALRVESLKAKERVLDIAGKTGRRTIPLSQEALAHFKECAKGKLPSAWLVSRADGSQWKKEAWRDEVKAAARKAKLPKATVAYTLRHSLITDLVVGGLDIFTVAKLAGTSVKMIEKHYGHLQREHARSALEKLALA